MNEYLVEKLKNLNKEEKQHFFFNFIYSFNYGEIKIKDKLFKTEQVNTVKTLIEAGFDVNTRNYLDATPLFYAQTKEMAEVLIQAGADVNTRDNQKATPLFCVNSKEIAEILIQHGADVNAKNNYGNTPLFSAKSKEIAEILIQHGADVNARNNEGQTPVEFCRSYGFADLGNFIEQKAIEFERKKLNQALPTSRKKSNHSKFHL